MGRRFTMKQKKKKPTANLPFLGSLPNTDVSPNEMGNDFLIPFHSDLKEAKDWVDPKE